MTDLVEYCQLHRCVIDRLADAVMITNCGGVIQYVNEAFEKITGYSREEAVGQTPRILKSNRQSAKFYRRMWSTLLRGKPFREVFVNRHKSGKVYYDEKTITPLMGADGEVTNFIAVGKDITQRIQRDERLSKLAYFDNLTGLPNRMLFHERLLRVMVHVKRYDQLLAVAFLDLDNFKLVNDDYGHFAGDDLLRLVAHRLQSCIRETDSVSRLAGDEFVILLECLRQVDDVRAIMNKILASFAMPFRIADISHIARSSIGVAFYPFEKIDAETLVRQADCAMYWAKQEGGGNCRYFEAGMDAGSWAKLHKGDLLDHPAQVASSA